MSIPEPGENEFEQRQHDNKARNWIHQMRGRMANDFERVLGVERWEAIRRDLGLALADDELAVVHDTWPALVAAVRFFETYLREL